MQADVPTKTQNTLADLVRVGRAQLSQAQIANPESEVAWILEAALGYNRLLLVVEGHRELSAERWKRAVDLLDRRAAREPLQYILGSQEFCGRAFTVTGDVLIPRPETEGLVEEVVQRCQSFSRPLLADIGTGSGCIAVSVALALPDSLIYATDVSLAALAVAKRNVERHGVGDRVRLLAGDLCGPLHVAGLEGQLAAIVSNPPYVAENDFGKLQPEIRCFEPRVALAAGVEGLDYHRRLLSEAAEFLVPGGVLAMEIGDGQAVALEQRAMNCHWYDQAWTKGDAAGIERILCLRRVP